MSTMVERIETFANAFWVAVAGAVVSFMGWMIRIIFTNQKALAELRAEINAREAAREAERQTISEIKMDIREIKGDVKHLYARDRDTNKD